MFKLEEGSANSTVPRRIFNLLVLYRWLSLIPPLALGILSENSFQSTTDTSTSLSTGVAIILAVTLNGFITLFSRQLNQVLRTRPFLLWIDLILVAGLMASTDGWRSPYYLYALNPLLAAAFFFQLRGALLVTTAFLPLYALAIIANGQFKSGSVEWLVVIMATVGFYLISGTFGYASILMQTLRTTKENLSTAHRDLKVLHQLTVSLHHSANIEEVQLQLLDAVTSQLGFQKAAVGLINGKETYINCWLVHSKGTNQYDEPKSTKIMLSDAETETHRLVRGVITKQKIRRFNQTSSELSNSIGESTLFDVQQGLLIPLSRGVQPIGVLMVDIAGFEENTSQFQSLEAIAQQTAVSLGMMMTRLRRAKESTIQEERNRIALDLHDTVSQSLFGLVYTLDGCLKLLPENPRAIKPELAWALETATDVRKKIRHTIHDIWPSELTAEQFQTDLHHYAIDVLQATGLQVTFEIQGDFSILSPPARRSLYRICQEALTNIVHHAAATESRICVDSVDGRVRLVIRDNGKGFETAVALSQEYEQEHFGLRGMQERAHTLGGTCDIFSQPAAGTSIVIDIPAWIQE